tara:strand:- start:634 stop:1170 length:537 start_codon:yes stop_codon:yes gene_type:complete
MNIVILGGSNDEFGILDFYTKKRCQEALKIISKNNEKNIILHFSGGINPKFNKMIEPISHSILCKKYFKNILNSFPEENIILHESNNCTIDEAINFGNYFKNFNNKIIIITNDWHYKRVNYLFSKVFKFNKINNFEIVGLTSDNDISKLINEEKLKVEQLKNNPYGIWKEWLLYNNLS